MDFTSGTGYVRRNCTYTSYLNTHFQSLVAEGCKIALYFIKLAGYKQVLFCHDEIVCEHPLENINEALEDVKNIMIESMKQVIPMNILAEGEIKMRYSK